MDVKVLIVDDSPVFREMFSKLLNESPGITVIGIATNADTAKEKIVSLKPDVVTLNLSSSKQNSIAFLKELMPRYPVPTVAITDTADEAFDTVNAGAVDFVKMPLIRTAASMDAFVQRLTQHIKVAAGANMKAAMSDNVVVIPPDTKPKAEPVKPKTEPVKLKTAPPPAVAAKAPAPEPAPKAKPAAEEKQAKPKAFTMPFFRKKPAENTANAPVEPAAKPSPAAEPAVKPKAPEPAVAPAVKPKVTEPAAEAAAKPKTAELKPAEPVQAEGGTNDHAARAAMAAAAAMQKITNPISPKGRRHVIALGASTGGTDALQTVLQDLPADTPGIVIVQHMPEMFTKMYADRLNRVCKMRCIEAVDGERVEPGKIILAAGNFHMRLAKDSRGYYVTSQKGEKVSGHCPSVDVLFESVAEVAGKDAIGAIFTGMGADGARGLKKMRDAGAFTIGQDQSSCVVYGMPAVAYNMGGVCQQAPLVKIPNLILENC